MSMTGSWGLEAGYFIKRPTIFSRSALGFNPYLLLSVSHLWKSHYMLWFKSLFFVQTIIPHHYYTLDMCWVVKNDIYRAEWVLGGTSSFLITLSTNHRLIFFWPWLCNFNCQDCQRIISKRLLSIPKHFLILIDKI